MPVWPSTRFYWSPPVWHGFWAGGGFALETAAARVCREAAGPRVDECHDEEILDLAVVNHHDFDARRLEVVADGLQLSGGAQLAIETTLVSPLHRDGCARPGAARLSGAAMQVACGRRERT